MDLPLVTCRPGTAYSTWADALVHGKEHKRRWWRLKKDMVTSNTSSSTHSMTGQKRSSSSQRSCDNPEQDTVVGACRIPICTLQQVVTVV